MNTHGLLSGVGVAVAMMVAFIAPAAQANAGENDAPFTTPAESVPASVTPASTGTAGFGDLVPRIEDAIRRLGYPKDVAKNLVELTRGWDWDAIMSSTLPKQRATLLDTTPKQQMTAFLARNIKAAFSFHNDADDLAKALTARTANCQAYVQLFYVLGTSAGLAVKVIQVSEMVDWNTGKSAGAHPDGGHVACLVELENGRVAIVDPTGNWVTEPFVFGDTYAKAGNFFELKELPDPWHPYNPLRLYPRIRIQPAGGIAASRMNSGGNRLADQVKAIGFYEKAMELDPSNSTSYQNRGTSYKMLGQLDKAAADFTMAIAIDPKWGVPYYGRGTVHSMKGQYDQALAAFDKAIALNNHRKELALWGLAEILTKRGQHRQAIVEYTKALAIKPQDPTLLTLRGNSYFTIGEYDQAIPDYSKAIDVSPNSAEAYVHRGHAMARLGRLSEAKSDLEHALMVKPDLKARILSISNHFHLGL